MFKKIIIKLYKWVTKWDYFMYIKLRNSCFCGSIFETFLFMPNWLPGSKIDSFVGIIYSNLFVYAFVYLSFWGFCQMDFTVIVIGVVHKFCYCLNY